MKPPLSPSEQLTFSTARIECKVGDGSSTGTGFFYKFLETGENHIPAIVTNKHVVKGSSHGRFHLTKRSDEGGPLPGKHLALEFDQFESRWIMHPDPAVDLCIMPLAPMLKLAEKDGHTFYYVSLHDELVWNDEKLSELTALEDIVMIGYPSGIWDKVNNMPIIRRGITATHPALDYEGRKEFMIDAACFPGSSGSPVLLYNLGSYASKEGGTVIGSRIALLGILYAGPQYTAKGEIEIEEVPTTQVPFAKSRIPINLGMVIKAQKLRDFDPILEKIKES